MADPNPFRRQPNAASRAPIKPGNEATWQDAIKRAAAAIKRIQDARPLKPPGRAK